MNFIIIFGPPAVGKMTVGIELEKLTGIKLFHNHDSIEPVLKIFDFGTESFARLVDNFRHDVFKEVANSDLSGLIFTFVWALDVKEDWDFLVKTCEHFNKVNANITLVELRADLNERLRRNQLPDRLAAKPSKRNKESSERNLLQSESYLLNSNDVAIDFPYRHLSIDSSQHSAYETARMIVKELDLETIGD